MKNNQKVLTWLIDVKPRGNSRRQLHSLLQYMGITFPESVSSRFHNRDQVGDAVKFELLFLKSSITSAPLIILLEKSDLGIPKSIYTLCQDPLTFSGQSRCIFHVLYQSEVSFSLSSQNFSLPQRFSVWTVRSRRPPGAKNGNNLIEVKHMESVYSTFILLEELHLL